MKQQEKFTFVEIFHFDNCFGCPYSSFHDDDNDCTHNMSTDASRLKKAMQDYRKFVISKLKGN